MKTITLAVLACLTPTVWGQDAPGLDSPLAKLLRESLFAEEAERDLDKAEASYCEVLERFDRERVYAATATLPARPPTSSNWRRVVLPPNNR